MMGEASLGTTKKGLNRVVGSLPASRVALEVGTHSPWVSRQLAKLRHEVLLAYDDAKEMLYLEPAGATVG